MGALRAAAGLIATAGDSAGMAEGRVRMAGSNAAAFGGEPAGESFSGACTRAASSLGTIADAMQQLANNTAAAAEGYVVTDQGAIPSSFGLHGVSMLDQRGP